MDLVKLEKGDAVKLVSNPDLVERLVVDGWQIVDAEPATQQDKPKRIKKA